MVSSWELDRLQVYAPEQNDSRFLYAWSSHGTLDSSQCVRLPDCRNTNVLDLSGIFSGMQEKLLSILLHLLP